MVPLSLLKSERNTWWRRVLAIKGVSEIKDNILEL
jgi:hypothetical protein